MNQPSEFLRKAGLFILLGLMCAHTQPVLSQQHSIIPAPSEYTAQPGYFYFKPTTYILVHDMASFLDAVAFRDMAIELYDLPIKVLKQEAFPTNFIDARYDSTLNIPDGGYMLDIRDEQITITGKNAGGVFHGLMTVLQIIETPFTRQFQIPCANIRDYPAFRYRGMHLDCVRHFFTVEEVKRYIDYLALYKMNTFHWHLTDDQGWRIEILDHPKLTEIGAWRSGSMVGHYRDHTYNSIQYGGYYTQEEIREVVKYAQRRNITIIPEIEMPGHCTAALAAYPGLGCIADTTYTVGKDWGVYQEVFCPTEETFQFLFDVLDEVMAMFPSPYIHIGGDEVEKTAWKKCDSCQALIQKLGLKDEHGLQSYFIRRIEQYVQSKGRQIIGWDEIMDGGLTENATIMSWRGEDGGIAAATQGYDAIMTPTSHCYFDYYQGSPTTEPLAIGGYVPLDKVYNYKPVPSSLTEEQSAHILGAQGNMWTEYMNTFDQVEYMLFPRLMALSEVLWSPPAQHDYAQFLHRVKHHFALLDRLDCTYSKTAFSYTASIDETPDHDGVQVTLHTWNDRTDFAYQYFTDAMQDLGYRIAVYEGPFTVRASSNYLINIPPTDTTSDFDLRLYFTKSTGKKCVLTEAPSKLYPGKGGFTLVDGITGTIKGGWSGDEWLGFRGSDMQCTIDLGVSDTISAVESGFLNDPGSWIHPPLTMEVAVSMDGKKFTRIGIIKVEAGDKPRVNAAYKFTPTAARFVRITATNHGTIEPGFPGAGQPSWLFADEIWIK